MHHIALPVMKITWRCYLWQSGS